VLTHEELLVGGHIVQAIIHFYSRGDVVVIEGVDFLGEELAIGDVGGIKQRCYTQDNKKNILAT